LTIYQAAAVRDALFRETRQDSYDYPSVRTTQIRESIVLLDKQLEKVLEE
jgi:hypothetical protein